uniref:Fungal lipase-type domain-containing protein n=1 Tax=Calcidiscus leptoporus TaxID=127549 RepID=A0A6U5D8P6_9EUKA|mmetsp:Transcript_12500/g.28843  ORF Transcript_12500/g.28843 Transcript_12500/m.28843 type:complete len:310 (+) Transcript_12500:2-931(+)
MRNAKGLLLSHFSADPREPSFYVARDSTRGGSHDVVIGVHYPASASEARTVALEYESVPFFGGKAHKALLANARAVLNAVKPIFLQHLELDSRVTLTGFSLGASTAILLHMLLFGEVAHDPDLLLAQSRITTFAFGAPQVFASLNAEVAGANTMPAGIEQRVFNVIHGFDPTPRLNVRNAVRLLLLCKEIDQQALGGKERLESLRGRSGAVSCGIPDHAKVCESAAGTFFPVGLPVLLREQNRGAVSCEVGAYADAHELRPHRSMFSDSASQVYLRAASAAAASSSAARPGLCSALDANCPCLHAVLAL